MVSTKFFRHLPPIVNMNLYCKFQNDFSVSFRDMKMRSKSAAILEIKILKICYHRIFCIVLYIDNPKKNWKSVQNPRSLRLLNGVKAKFQFKMAASGLMLSTKFFCNFSLFFNMNLHCKFQNDRINSFRDIKIRPKFQFKMAALPLTPEPSNSLHSLIHVNKIIHKKFHSIPFSSFGEISFGKMRKNNNNN